VPDDRPTGSATPAGPTHEALDVPVINASRGEDFLGASSWPLVVWTGTEAAFLYTTPGRLMERLWVGRMDGRGKVLDRRKVALDREVDSSLYPAWVDGTIAAVHATGLTNHWIEVVPDGRVRGIEQLREEKDQHVRGTLGAMHASGRFAVASFFGEVERNKPNRQQLELYDARAKHIGAVPLDCGIVGDIVATDWGYAVFCHPNTDAHTSKVLGIRDGKVEWTFGGLPARRAMSLGSDGQRVLIIFFTESDSELTYPVMTQLLDRDGRPEAPPITTLSHVPQTREPMIWTGKEFATFDEFRLIRYASDGRPLGVWEVEPRCNRDFQITSLAWTGSAYLVLGGWGWSACYDGYGRVTTDEDREYPLAPGLIWDPATDAIEPPEWLHDE